jgi:hypothetical protein
MTKYLAVYRLGGSDYSTRSGRQIITISDAGGQQITLRSQDFDPIYYMQGGGDVLEHVLGHASAGEGKISEVTVRKAENPVLIEVKHLSTVRLYEIDLLRGGQLVALTRTDGLRRERWTWDVVEQADVWVPATISIEQVSLENPESFHRTIEFIESVVNGPLSPREFSLASLGARAGDVVMDEVANAKYVLQSRTADTGSVARNPNSKEPSEGSRDISRYLVLNLLGWIVVLCIAAFLLRRKSSNPFGDGTRE